MVNVPSLFFRRTCAGTSEKNRDWELEPLKHVETCWNHGNFGSFSDRFPQLVLFFFPTLANVRSDLVSLGWWFSGNDRYDWLVVSNMAFIFHFRYGIIHPSHWRTPSFFKMGTLHQQPVELIRIDHLFHDISWWFDLQKPFCFLWNPGTQRLGKVMINHHLGMDIHGFGMYKNVGGKGLQIASSNLLKGMGRVSTCSKINIKPKMDYFIHNKPPKFSRNFVFVSYYSNPFPKIKYHPVEPLI